LLVSVPAVGLLALSAAANAAPIPGANYADDGLSPTDGFQVDFTVGRNTIDDGQWAWPMTCTNYEGGEEDIQEASAGFPQGFEFDEAPYDVFPMPIDSSGHFRSEVNETTESTPTFGSSYITERHIYVDGTIDGSEATGTASWTENVYQNPGAFLAARCESGIVSWFAKTNAVTPACEDAKERVATLKAKVRAATNPDKRRRLKKKLENAREHEKAVCG
jgi:hypothetical protein